MNLFGQPTADVVASAVAARMAVATATLVPASLRAPGFGPVDPKIAEANPGKDGPSEPADGVAFQTGEQVTVFVFGKGPKSPVHLVLDLEPFNGVAEIDRILSGESPGVPLSAGDRLPVWNEGTGNGGFGGKLEDRLDDADPANDTIIVPILATLPGSRNADGQLVGDLEVVDFAAVRLDAVIEVDIPDPNKPDDPTKTITIRLLVGTIVEVQIASTPSPNPAGIANSVFTLQIVK